MIVKKELLYGGPITPGKRYIYVAYMLDQRVGSGTTKEEAIHNAQLDLLSALNCQQNQPCASIAPDGTILTTREYSHGQVEFVYNRSIDKCNGSMLSNLEIDGRSVTAREFHKHYVAQYIANTSERAA